MFKWLLKRKCKQSKDSQCHAVSKQFVLNAFHDADRRNVETFEISHHKDVSCWLCEYSERLESLRFYPIFGIFGYTLWGRKHIQHSPCHLNIINAYPQNIIHTFTQEGLKQNRLDNQHKNAIYLGDREPGDDGPLSTWKRELALNPKQVPFSASEISDEES